MTFHLNGGGCLLDSGMCWKYSFKRSHRLKSSIFIPTILFIGVGIKDRPWLRILSSTGSTFTFPILKTLDEGSPISLFLLVLLTGCLFRVSLLLAKPQSGLWQLNALL